MDDEPRITMSLTINPRNKEILRRVAKKKGLSMGQLVEQMAKAEFRKEFGENPDQITFHDLEKRRKDGI